MITPEKIEEWLKEAEERPESAGLILKYIANRLHDLTARNEELMAENIALQNKEKVQEYEKRIAHLEYQLSLLKRQVAVGGSLTPENIPPMRSSLLIYNLQGRVIRLDVNKEDSSAIFSLGQLNGELLTFGEPPRLSVVSALDELLFLYTSGRVSVHPVASLSQLSAGGELSFARASLPDDSHPGERLTSLVSIGQLPLSDYFIQVSRRGCVKKTMASIAESILSNHFIGRGLIKKADQPFEIMLGRKGDRLVIVTEEGQLLYVQVDDLSYAIEERMQLAATDHVVAAFVIHSRESVVMLTKNGKVILRSADHLEPARASNSKGLPLISSARREQGVRAIDAVAVNDDDDLIVLHGDGMLSDYSLMDLSGSGSTQNQAGVLAIASLPAKPFEK
jgi:DNA gyrase/topoisomerase IV subunit A